MRRARLLRLFWIGAAAILVVAALVALVAVLGGHFDETDGKILGVLGTALLAGGVATAGATLYDSRTARRFGAAVVATAPLWFGLASAAIVDGFDSKTLNRLAWTAYVLLATELVVATARMLVGHRPLLKLYALTAGFGAAAALTSITAIWERRGGSGYAKVIASLWILTVVSYLLIPVARRISGAPDGGAVRQVDLDEGVTIARARVRLTGATAAPRGEALYVVLGGHARLGDLELGPGQAAVAPPGTTPVLTEDAEVLLITAEN